MLKRKPLFISLVTLLFFFFASPKLAFASTYYLSPGSGNIYVGGTKSVSVVLNAGGDSVNAVSAYLSYPADKLDVVWVSPSGTFPVQAENSFGAGSIKISRGNFSGVSGNVTIATIGFRGKKSGQATVAFVGGSQAPRASDSSNSLNLGGSSGGVYTVGGQAPASAPGEIKDKEQIQNLVISDLKAYLLSTNSATISWKTNIEADSLVDYGAESGKYFLTASNKGLTRDHSVKLQNPVFVPGTLFHFRVTSKTDAGTIALSKDDTFQLPGYTVKIKAMTPEGKPLVNVEVALYSDPQIGKTDQNGEVVFVNVVPGNHLVLVKNKGAEKSFEVMVKVTSSTSDPQTFTVKANLTQSIGNLILVGIAVGVCVLLIVAAVVLLKKRKKSPPPVANPYPEYQNTT